MLLAHALVAAPRLALGRLAPLARLAGDPRVGMTGVFLSLSRVLPDTYPLGDDVDSCIAVEHGFGHLLDVGIITPLIRALFDWSARELELPALSALVHNHTPAYAWDYSNPPDVEVWRFQPSWLAQAARRLVPASDNTEW